MIINWNNTHFVYQVNQRVIDLEKVENTLRFSTEKYFDNNTGRYVKIGGNKREGLLLVSYEIELDESVTPITVHQTDREQINHRLNEGRYEF